MSLTTGNDAVTRTLGQRDKHEKPQEVQVDDLSGDGEQHPPSAVNDPRCSPAVQRLHAVLVADGGKARQLARDPPDLDGGRDEHRPGPRRVVDQQLSPCTVPAEERVLHPAARGRHVEPLTIPAEPVRSNVRPAVRAVTREDQVAALGKERPQAPGERHSQTRYIRTNRPFRPVLDCASWNGCDAFTSANGDFPPPRMTGCTISRTSSMRPSFSRAATSAAPPMT